MSRRSSSIAWMALALAAVYAVCLVAGRAPAFCAPQEGAAWARMHAFAARWWTGSALVTPAAGIDPAGLFADDLTSARGGRWRSKAAPLLPLAASVPYALLGTAGAHAVPAAAAIACLLLSARIGRRLAPGSGAGAAAGAVAATPLVVHGSLFSPATLAAALVLGALDRLLAAEERTRAGGGDPERAFLGAGLCAGCAPLADPAAVWFIPAAGLAWLLTRRRRARSAPDDREASTPIFLAAAAGLHAVLGLAVPALADLGGRGSHAATLDAPAWGSPLLLPVLAPAVLAGFGLLQTAGARRIRLLLVSAGVLVQAAGLWTTLSIRAGNAGLIEEIARASDPGGAVLTEAPELPALAAAISPERAIFHVRPGAEPEALLRGLDAAGVNALAAASPARGAEAARLAERAAICRFVRTAGPVRVRGFLVSRFEGVGAPPSRPSAPPRGD